MDGTRTEVLVAAGLVLAGSFVMGILGASVAIERIETRRARDADSVDRELDQVQEDLDDLDVRLKEAEVGIKVLQAAHEDPV